MIKRKRLALFLHESIIIQKRSIISIELAEQLNGFICEQYEKDKDSLSVLFDTKLLGEHIKEKTSILTIMEILQLLRCYSGIDNYIKLIEEAGQEDGEKINDLALLFAEYCKPILELPFANGRKYYPKGYPRILQ